VGEAVGVTDHELVEGELRIEPVVFGDLWQPASRGPGRARPALAYLDPRSLAEDPLGAGAQDAREAICHPCEKLVRGLDDHQVVLDGDGSQRGEPDVVGVRRDRFAQLVLNRAPDVVGVLGHGMCQRLLRR
jgi:hypothetical protein